MDELTRLLREERGIKEQRRQVVVDQQRTLEDELRMLTQELSAIDILIKARKAEPDLGGMPEMAKSNGSPDLSTNIQTEAESSGKSISPTNIVVAFVLSSGVQGANLEEIWNNLLVFKPDAKRKDLHTILSRQVNDTRKFIEIGERYVHVDNLKIQTTSE